MVGSLLGSPLLVSCCYLSGNGNGNGSALSKTTTNTDGFPTLPKNVTNTDGFPTLPKTLSLRTSTGNNVKTPLTRNNFPEDFIFGSASSAYQIEGAWNEDGKGPSIWDTFTHQQPEKIQDRSNGNVAIDSYHRYKEDIDIMKHIGLDAYRFSIAWTRILPRGNLKGGVNQAGIKHYSDLIDYMLSKGLKPFATIFHWDVPQHLEDEYGGFLSPKIIEDYKDFANICFREFGDRVKHWITVNEPQTFAEFGYATGVHAPGRCSPNVGNCRAGDSGTEPYQVGHHLLLAHATAVKLYREEYQSYQDGTIGLSLATPWVVPLSETMSDHHAAQRSIDFSLGWYMEPLTSGNYPLSMISRVRERLPKFTREESELVKGSYDFIGVNYYTGNYATEIPPINNIPPNYMTDSHAYLLMKRNGKPIGDQAVSSWLYTFSQGIRDLTVYIKERYNNPTMYITENGMDQAFSQSSLEESLRDNMRVYYYYHHLAWLLEALERDNVDVRGHFAWSIFDNFEWANGYQIRFGINYVDYENNLKRFAKNSAIWFQNFLNGYKEFETVERTNYNRLLKTTIGH